MQSSLKRKFKKQSLKKKLLTSLLSIFILSSFSSANAEESNYANMKASEANLRVGPGLQYDVYFKLSKADVPLKVVDEFEHWRKVEDFDGDQGWVHKALLNKKRTGVITNVGTTTPYVSIYEEPLFDAEILANLESGVIISIEECAESFCLISKEHDDNIYQGWLPKSNIWGVDTAEVF